ncbi:dipeptide epimerase [Agriterribacter sp.]|uniref:mandelate racemase/muconate lactonizing enzyme family protein n=1 Tax=Agriterribacter sp. TaxID=2821509 RepID=UPI002C5965AB|nr:dipeptide epimerase [Agriterribacter sp.]HRP55596.1 dipeptide epimerase [Agriterribacter sp.]
MKITHTSIYKFSIPMHPFTIATGTMHFAQNIFIRVYTSGGIYGVGECSAFPMIVGETQATCFEMAKDFALLWKNKDPLNIPERMSELHAYTAYNSTAKSAFDMALYDISAKAAGKPLYEFLGGKKKSMETDLTIGIDTPKAMAEKAVELKNRGVRIIKVKLGREPQEDIERVKRIREAIGDTLRLRIDANQGWNKSQAQTALTALSRYNIEFCEQPMRRHDDHFLPELKRISPVPIMADESVFDHYDAERIIKSNGCSYINIKFAKSGGILEAQKINEVCRYHNIPCMMGGMLESRIALTAFAHFAAAAANVKFYDMDTCLLGHKLDPVTGGVAYNNFHVELPDAIGIGADADESFLLVNEHITI